MSIDYTAVKEFIKDVRDFMKRIGRKSSDDPGKCDRCRLFKFCVEGLGFLLNIGGLDKDKIKIEEKKEGIMTLDLRKISKEARRFLSDSRFRDFHDTLHDYAESTNYVGVVNHILAHMSYFDFWLNEIAVLSDDHPSSCIGMLQQLVKYLPMIYKTDKDPYAGGFRCTKLTKGFFSNEAEDKLEEAINLLKAGDGVESKKIMKTMARSVGDLRSELLEDYRIALDSSLVTGDKLRQYFGENRL